MEKIKSPADLKRIKEEAQAKIELREKSEHPEQRIQVKVAMGTCGIAAGSKATMECFLEQVKQNGLDAVVTQTDCMGYCEEEPTVEITKPGEQSTVFKKVDCTKVKEIVQNYLMKHL